MHAILIRLLGWTSFASAILVVGPWLLDPRLPVAGDPANRGAILQQFMPFLALPISVQAHSGLGSAPLWLALSLTAMTILGATGLAAWLASRTSATPALRYLIVGLALSGLAIDWFAFARHGPLALSMPVMRSLDYVAMIAAYAGAWAVLACVSIYPEPISRTLLSTSIQTRSGTWLQRASRQRAGEGIWRWWSWLPRERYGEYGRQHDPTLLGPRRLLRSRELVWLLVFLMMTALAHLFLPLVFPFAGKALLVTSLVVGYFSLYVLDPLFASRMEYASLSGPEDSLWIAAGASEKLLRWAISRYGLLCALILAIATTACWHHSVETAKVAAALLAASLIVGAGLVINCLHINWLSGNTAQRRAIGWIYLGTVGVTAVWLLSQVVLGLYGFTQLTERAPALGALPTALHWQMVSLIVGVPLSMLAFVLSLWASILHRGSFDPALAMRRGASIIALGVVLTSLFVAVEGAVSSLIVSRLGMPSASGPVVAGTAVALAFQPMRTRLERLVQRAMLRLLPPEAIADGERRTQAVLFADLSGYTRLAETDEAEAVLLAALLHRHARLVCVRRDGRLIKTIGDAVLCTFENADQALSAAIELHREYHQEVLNRNLELLPIHAGLHVGEVVIARGEDVFGATVNLAARLLNLAGADELITTQTAQQAIASAGLSAEVLPARRFKNIAEPIDCWRVRLSTGV